MEINFDGLRKNIAHSLNGLIRVLNTEMDGIGTIEVDAKDIRIEIDDLRAEVATLLCCYDEKAEIDDLSGSVKLIEFAPKENY